MAKERTLIIVKPDAVQRGLVGPILSRLEGRGLKLVGLKLMQVPRSLAERHYAEHEGKGFYEKLLDYITSAPVVVGCVEGTSAVQAVRSTVGATNPAAAGPGTIRGDFGRDWGLKVQQNLVHGSDSAESAGREIKIWFQG